MQTTQPGFSLLRLRWGSLLFCLCLLSLLSGCLVVRTGVGVGVATPKKRLKAPSAAAPDTSNDEDPVVSFAFDVTLGLHFPLNLEQWFDYGAGEIKNAFSKHKTVQRTPGMWWLLPEMGFSLDHQAFPANFHIGLGLSYTFPTKHRMGIGYIPSLVVGYSTAEQVEVGFRNSLYLYALYFLSVELQWEIYPNNSGTLHNFRALIGIDLVPIFNTFLRDLSRPPARR